MSHSKDEEEQEDIQCLLDHVEILNKTLNGINGEVSKKRIIAELKEVKKRVDYMLKDLESK